MGNAFRVEKWWAFLKNAKRQTSNLQLPKQKIMVETYNRPPKTLEGKLERLFMKLRCLKAPACIKEFRKQHENTGQDTCT